MRLVRSVSWLPSAVKFRRVVELAAIGTLLAASSSLANTPGRSWSPVETLSVSGMSRLYTPRLEVDGQGVPYLFAGAQAPGIADNLGFTWGGEAWAETWQVGRGLNFSWRVWAPPGEFFAVGQDPIGDSEDKAWLYLAEKVGESFAVENVVRTGEYLTDYSAAVSPLRRWLLFDDFGGLRLFFSDQFGVWEEAALTGIGEQGLSIAALDDTTALLAWAASNPEQLRWGTLAGTTWIPGPEPLGDALSINPTLRKRPSGGYWMGYATSKPYVLVRSYYGGNWAPPDTVRAVYRSSAPDWRYYSSAFEMSRDSSEFPALAWGTFDGSRGVSVICVSSPTSVGWTTADEIADSEGGILPTVARDVNGDAWVAFWRYGTNGVFWAHTHSHATTSVPVASGSPTQLMISWQLSEPAPETWWSVLREQEGGSFEPVARVQAGSSTEMNWLDLSASPGARYRIRRECLDTRYQWLSEISGTPVAVMLSLMSAEASPGQVRLSWYAKDASGAATVSRRTAVTDWTDLGAAKADGDGLLTYVDSGLPAGRYAYRIQLGGEVTPEAWVDVPPGFALALAGFRPNPAVGSLQIVFTLANDSPATVAVFAVNGRRLLEREVSSLGAGDHVLDVARAAAMRPGVYWIRLTQAGASLTRKGVLAN